MTLPLDTDSENRLATLLREVWDEVCAYAERRLPGDPQQAEDLVQEAAADLVRRWHDRGEVSRSRAVAMLKTSIKRDIVDLWRSQGRRLTSPVAVDDRVLLDHLDRDTGSEHEILALLIALDDKTWSQLGVSLG
ncbi:hypothetical protein ADK67_42060 [Saccharothrix sp. NRRL B-16348]|uniref:RNA polymerase sigma factor n=1 Tax=Saccharothrix sp. NRRL B-16348 TaxID=1415542 RepID=UPI0006B0520C|nr:sigma factor [Saccharothrix sp. NRRL B-16348]KOX14543.1 hypothetical protein ADK67_42060 [Saccharothrix sp. NRRL B-16348]